MTPAPDPPHKPPPNFCARRQLLYQTQLDETKKFLEGFLQEGVFTSADRPRLQRAVRDKALVDALEAILIPLVVCGVARDFEHLRKSQALFCGDASNHPKLSEVLPTGGPFPDAPPKGYKVDANVRVQAAYDRYFDWYIKPADVGGGVTGLAAFYQRYPLLDYAVKTVASHYQHNIQLACERVAADWSDIGKAFFPKKKLKRLKKIKTTGNDFHKGGKQVLILTFEFEGGQGRVVYKPSAIEIDCRIVGDSTVFKRVSPKGSKDDAGYTQAKSLTELINDANPGGKNLGSFTTRGLPTYSILPYNRGCVPDAYGYIEFLTHNPKVDFEAVPNTDITPDVVKAIMALDPAKIRNSDWIVDSPAKTQRYFHQFGGLMAMALAVSLCDLHIQNVIVHDGAPHLIDLEEALKQPMTTVEETYLAGKDTSPIGHYSDPESPRLEVTADLTSDLRIEGKGWSVPFSRPASSALYVFPGTTNPDGTATPAYAARLDPPDPHAIENRSALLLGFTGVIDALASPACNEAVQAWVRDLRGTLARFVTRATRDYASAGRQLYWLNCDADVRPVSRDDSPRAPDGWYDRVGSGDGGSWFRSQVASQRSGWGFRSKGNPLHPPFFALEHPDHAWRDYLNFDVPCFYHLLGSADLLNSKGGKVDVDAAAGWQDRNLTPQPSPPPGWQPNTGGPYLTQPPIAMVLAQLTRLKQACWLPADQRTPERVKAKKAFLTQSFERTGLAGDFKLVTSQRQPMRSGAHA